MRTASLLSKHQSNSYHSLADSLLSSLLPGPLSNAYFSPTKMLPLLPLLSSHPSIHIGLGTDISGGYDSSMASSMRWAVATSRLETGLRAKLAEPGIVPAATSAARVDGAERGLTWRESIYLATLGGASAMGDDRVTGSLEVGKAFDAQLIVLDEASEIDIFDADEPLEACIERWWCNGTKEDRKGVWVQGRRLRAA